MNILTFVDAAVAAASVVRDEVNGKAPLVVEEFDSDDDGEEEEGKGEVAEVLRKVRNVDFLQKP